MSGNGEHRPDAGPTIGSMSDTHALDDEARYQLLCCRDSRFDGRFFAGVTSTGVYCRPICGVRTPRRANCRFFDTAAQAELAGFRPCLRCRPELAPGQRHWSQADAGSILIHQAIHWMQTPHPDAGPGTQLTQRIAQRLGVSDRHLRRLFEHHLGVSPLQYLQTQRLLCAKQLLADTRMPIAEVAQASGFASLRRFNAAFLQRYGLNPSDMRRNSAAGGASAERAPTGVRLSWRPPFQAQALFRFLAQRSLAGMEEVDVDRLTLRRSLCLEVAGVRRAGWLQVRLEPAAHRLLLTVSDPLMPVLPGVIERVRAAFDLDADPMAIDAVLHEDFPGGDGLRVPGCFDGFELAVRAVLGQQVSVAAARTLCARLVHRLGEPLETGQPGLDRLFPTPAALASVSASTWAELGIVRQRQRAIQALAQAVLDGHLQLDERSHPLQTMTTLQTLPGIGPWTASYVAMRALRWPDAWPAGDLVLQQVLGLDPPGSHAAARQAEERSQRWRPWRSYALMRAWQKASTPTTSQ